MILMLTELEMLYLGATLQDMVMDQTKKTKNQLPFALLYIDPLVFHVCHVESSRREEYLCPEP